MIYLFKVNKWFIQSSQLLLILAILSLLNASASCLSNEKELSLNDQLLWGTYKPYLISAITQRSNHPITLGMAFSKNFMSKPSLEDFKKSLKFRMNQQLFAQYTHHNGFNFSRQAIIDESLALYYDISFIKEIKKLNSSNEPIQEWSYSIQSQYLNNEIQAGTKQSFSTFFYISLENLEIETQDFRSIQIMEDFNNEQSMILRIFDSKTETHLGFVKLQIPLGDKMDNYSSKYNKIRIYQCLVSDYNKMDVWKVEDIIYHKLSTNVFKGISALDPQKCQENLNSETSNMFLLQIVSDQPIQLIASFSSAEVPIDVDYPFLREIIYSKEKDFEESLSVRLPIKNLNRYKFNIEEAIEIQKFILSNLLGRIAYLPHTNKRLQNGKDLSGSNSNQNTNLLTVLPSRTQFDQNFIFQNGFDNRVLCRWNLTLCLELIKIQFTMMHGNCSLALERLSFSEELKNYFQWNETSFESQRNLSHPSLILSINYLLNQVNKNVSTQEEDKVEEIPQELKQAKEFLSELLPKLQDWFQELEKQKLVLKKNESFCSLWNSRPQFQDISLILGLNENSIQHTVLSFWSLDLHVWLTIIVKNILDIEMSIKQTLNEKFTIIQKDLNKSLQNYLDPTNNLMKSFVTAKTRDDDKSQQHTAENSLFEKYFSPYKGQTNLSPLFSDVIKLNDLEKKALINLISSPELLWTSFGVRSLSKGTPQIWKERQLCTDVIEIDLNFLLLRGLKINSANNLEIQELYEALREKLLKTISLNWKLTHKVWGVYDAITGIGKSCCEQEGFSSLIALILSEEYD